MHDTDRFYIIKVEMSILFGSHNFWSRYPQKHKLGTLINLRLSNVQPSDYQKYWKLGAISL